ncbi:MAG: TIGR02679 family protein [Myxococcaceae bacterium]
MTDRRRLVEAVGAEELRWIWERVHARVLQGQECRTTIRLPSPTEAQRSAVARLLGRIPRGAGLGVQLEELEKRLREAGLAGSLAEAAGVVLGKDAGHLRDRSNEEVRSWSAAVASAAGQAEAAGGAVRVVVREAIGTGLLRRLSGRSVAVSARLVEGLLRLSERLPARGVPLAQLAAEVAGDAHALDEGAALGALGTRLAATLGGVGGWEEPEGRREAWAKAGVLCDELSAPALALNLTSGEDGPLGQVIRTHAAVGEPLRISIRQLVRSPPGFAVMSGARVFVCENPTVLAAAANALGRDCAPLVCTEGMPRTAVRMLLELLAKAGAAIAFHADFDWAGVRIGNLIGERHGACAWRMSAADYLAGPPGPALGVAKVAARWEETLLPRMLERGVAVHEEAVLPGLLEDLRGR